MAWSLLTVLLSVTWAVTQVSAALIFDNGFEDGIADWSETGGWKPVPANASASNISREGTNSVRFLPVAGNSRSEFVIRGGSGSFAWGTEYWLGYSLLVVQPVGGLGIISDHHSTPHSVGGVANWKVRSGECSFLIKIVGNDFQIHTATDPGKVFVTPSNSALSGTKSIRRPFLTNTWYDFVLHFNLATNSTGIMEVWLNGEKVVDVQAGPTVYAFDASGQPKTPVNYQKVGTYYGMGNEADGGEVLYDAFRIWEGPGGSYAAVAAGGGSRPIKKAATGGYNTTTNGNQTINPSPR